MNSEKKQKISVVEARRGDVAWMADCHIAAFPGRFMTRMGFSWLCSLYNFFVTHRDGVCYIAANAAGRVVGFAVGGEPDIREQFLRFALLRYPHIVFWKFITDSLVRTVLIEELLKKLRLKQAPFSNDNDKAQEYCGKCGNLLSICVLPEWMGTGIADRLIESFQKACAVKGYNRLTLSVVGDNSRAIAFYKKHRWYETGASGTSTKFAVDLSVPLNKCERSDVQELLFVSVIMPVRNEADFIEQAVQSILDNEYPAGNMEILVVDGMSDDGTREIVERLSQADSRVKLLDNPRRIVPPAMNIGIKAARGDVFVRIDGHARVPEDFIGKSVQCLREHPDAWVAGGYIETVADNYIGGAIASAMRSPIGVGNARFRTGDYDGWVDTLAFGMHHKWVVDKIGYFDEELVRNQDDEFNLRIILAGGKICMSKSIRSTYFSRTSLSNLWRQYFQYGFWRIRTFQKHKRPATPRQLVPLLFVLSILLLGVAGFLWTPFWILLVTEIILYVLGLIVGAFDVGRKSEWRFAPIAPLVFMILHFAYGLGSFWGVIRFSVLKNRDMKKAEEIQMSR